MLITFTINMETSCRFEFLVCIYKTAWCSSSENKNIDPRDLRHTRTSVAAEITGFLQVTRNTETRVLVTERPLAF